VPKIAKELSALEVKRLQHSRKKGNCTYAVGGVAGLMIQFTPSGAKSWLLRTTVGMKRREFGLGGYPEIGLATARNRARELKEKIRDGIDPLQERKEKQAALITAQRRGLVFSEAVDQYLSAKLDQYKNPKHRQQWRNTLRTYAIPELGSMLVHDIQVQDILRVLQPIWIEKTETASRLRGRIESILSWATVSGHRSGDNPARWAGNLKELLPAPSKVAKETHHPALQINDVQRWLAAVRKMKGMGGFALEFALLTATRSQEIRGAKWSEIDLEKALWVIPAQRMKKEREHRIPLSSGAVELLGKVPRFEGTDLIFPAPRGGMLSDMTLSAAMKRIHEADLKETGIGFIDHVSARTAVPHGLRSTFRDWIAESTSFPSDMAEVALAHKVPNAVEAAYRRGDMVDRRRTMMQAWSDFTNGLEANDNVLEFKGNV